MKSDKRRVGNWYEIRKRGQQWQLIGRYNGVRVRKSLETGGHAEAVAKAKALWARIGDLTVGGPVTMAELAKSYFTRRLPLTCTPQDIRNREGDWRNHFASKLDRIPVASVTYENLLDTTAGFATRKLSTRRKLMRMLRSILLHGLALRLVTEIPWGPELMPKRPKHRPRPYPETDLNRAMARMTEDQRWSTRAFVLTGLRAHEAVGLRPEHFVDLPAPAILVRGKGGRDRLVFLSPEAVEHFRARRHLERVWPLNLKAFEHLANRSEALTGVRVTPHRLRHTFACRYLADGGNLKALQRLMGHASITTTEGYADLDDELVAQDVQRVYGHKYGHKGRRTGGK